MTMTLKKRHAAMAVLALALIAPATALATHVFDDVADDRFFTVPVEWAKDNGLTTGSPAGSSTFLPFENVTRAENITFNYRYDQNIVQPALAAKANSSDVYTRSETNAAIAAAVPTLLTARGSASSSGSTIASDVAGTSVTFTVPAGITEVVVVTFSAESECHQDPVSAVWCFVSLQVDGTTPSESVTVFDSVRHAANTTQFLGRGSHSFQWVSGPLAAGTHTITPQFGVDESNAFFTLTNPNLTVLRMPAANVTSFSSLSLSDADDAAALPDK